LGFRRGGRLEAFREAILREEQCSPFIISFFCDFTLFQLLLELLQPGMKLVMGGRRGHGLKAVGS
jgi:hypothetical protein